MKKLLKNELILCVTLVTGLACAFLHHRMMTTALDEKGLLIPGNSLSIGLWALCLGFLAFALAISQVQKVTAPFRLHFPACKIRGCLGMAGGVITVLYSLSILLQPQLLVGIPGIAAGICMVFTGLCRFRGRHPSPMFHCVVCIFFVIRLVLSFQKWSSDPQLQDYVLALLALIGLMMFAFHRASSDANTMNPKRTAFFSLCAGFFCLASLSDPSMRLLMLGAGMWSVGAAPTLEPLPEPETPAEADRKEEEEEM